MDDDRFRSFFGFPGSTFGYPKGDYQEEDSEFDDPGDIFDRFRFGAFGRGAPFNDMNDVFKGAETMLRHMDNMFRDMHILGDSGSSFPKLTGSISQEDLDDPYRESRRTPRDEMLKVPDSAANSPETAVEFVSGQADVRRPFLGWNQGHSSITTFAGLGNGKVEQRRTVQNSDGSSSTTVTRRLGDREMNITTRVNRNGETEVEEDLVNFGEDEKEAFEAEWKSQSGVRGDRRDKNPERTASQTKRNHEIPPPILDPQGPSIFQRIFGSWR